MRLTRDKRPVLRIVGRSGFMPHSSVSSASHPRGAMLCVLAIVIVAAGIPRSGQAWGPKAIAVIAQVAQDRLSPSGLSSLQALLPAGVDLAGAILRANEMLVRNGSSTSWQYSTSVKSHQVICIMDSLPATCLVELLRAEFLKAQDAGQSVDSRFRSLCCTARFLVDIHDPFQCLTSRDDSGLALWTLFAGLDRVSGSVTFSNAWDRIADQVSSPGTKVVAKRLGRAITPSVDDKWTNPNALLEDWASESHLLAVDLIRLAQPSQPGSTAKQAHLPMGFRAQQIPTVKEQMEKAGVRLAFALEAMFYVPTPDDEARESATTWH